jgi:hypothetical protein
MNVPTGIVQLCAVKTAAEVPLQLVVSAVKVTPSY